MVLARRCFLTLEPLGDYLYVVLNDDNFVTKFFARDNETAIKIFNLRKYNV